MSGGFVSLWKRIDSSSSTIDPKKETEMQTLKKQTP